MTRGCAMPALQHAAPHPRSLDPRTQACPMRCPHDLNQRLDTTFLRPYIRHSKLVDFCSCQDWSHSCAALQKLNAVAPLAVAPNEPPARPCTGSLTRLVSGTWFGKLPHPILHLPGLQGGKSALRHITLQTMRKRAHCTCPRRARKLSFTGSVATTACVPDGARGQWRS